MFTGIITNIALINKLTYIENKDLNLELKLNSKNIDRDLKIGSSISCNGVCLTLIQKRKSNSHYYLNFNISNETISKTTIQNWEIEDKVNIEFAMRAGDEFGGHFVNGHISDIAHIKDIKKISDSYIFKFKTKIQYRKFIYEKGSVAINGISLTVNDINNFDKNYFIFDVNIIDHTFKNTNFKFLNINDIVNFEIDSIASNIL